MLAAQQLLCICAACFATGVVADNPGNDITSWISSIGPYVTLL